MESNYDPMLIKEKFSSLIVKLHDVGFTDELITYKMIKDPFFLCFERNEYLSFLRTPMEEIISRVFGRKNVLLEYDKAVVSEYYWAGNMYFSLLNDYHVPLQKLFLIWPLSRMVAKFDPYHEMPISALYRNYVAEEKETGIFKALKSLSLISNRELSVLTGISENTLRTYYDNSKLFNASFENISLLSEALCVNSCIFKKNSSFVMINDYLFKDEQFLSAFKQQLVKYYGIKDDVLLITDYVDAKQLVPMIKEHKKVLYLPEYAFIRYDGHLIYKFLKDSEIYLLANQALQNMQE